MHIQNGSKQNKTTILNILDLLYKYKTNSQLKHQDDKIMIINKLVRVTKINYIKKSRYYTSCGNNSLSA